MVDYAISSSPSSAYSWVSQALFVYLVAKALHPVARAFTRFKVIN